VYIYIHINLLCIHNIMCATKYIIHAKLFGNRSSLTTIYICVHTCICIHIYEMRCIYTYDIYIYTNIWCIYKLFDYHTYVYIHAYTSTYMRWDVYIHIIYTYIQIYDVYIHSLTQTYKYMMYI